MSFKTASALLKGIWLIEPSYAKALLPIVSRMIAGERLDPASFYSNQSFGNRDNTAQPPKKLRVFAASRDVYETSPSPYFSVDRIAHGSIAMVDVIGPVLKYGDECSYGIVDTNNLLIRLGNSDRVAGILLNVDSPGGQADGTSMIGQTIRDIAKNQKPVIGIIQDGVAASAGYWIASQAQEVYVTTATDKVGSIGAYSTLVDFSGYFEQKGIKVMEIYAPQSADKNKDYYDALKGDDAAVKADLKVLVDDFIGSVKSARGGRLNTSTEDPFTGKMYFAQQAKKIGLIDGVKTMGQAVNRLDQLIKLRA